MKKFPALLTGIALSAALTTVPAANAITVKIDNSTTPHTCTVNEGGPEEFENFLAFAKSKGFPLSQKDLADIADYYYEKALKDYKSDPKNTPKPTRDDYRIEKLFAAGEKDGPRTVTIEEAKEELAKLSDSEESGSILDTLAGSAGVEGKINIEEKLAEAKAKLATLPHEERIATLVGMLLLLAMEYEHSQTPVMRDAYQACIDGKDYTSPKVQPGATNDPSDTNKPGEETTPGDTEKPGDTSAPGGTNNPGNPGTPNQDASSKLDAKTKNGLIAGGVIAAVLGIIAIALPALKNILPPQIAALLP